jgi:hypothetical protein
MLLALALALTLVPAAAPRVVFAEGDSFSIGGTPYATLDAAIDAVPTGGSATIHLDGDATVTSPVVIDSKDIQLNLSGSDLAIDTSAATLPDYCTPALTIKGGASLSTLGASGSLNVTGKYYGLRAESGASVAITGDITTTQRYSDPDHYIWGEGNAIGVDGTSIEIDIAGDISSAFRGIELSEGAGANIEVGNIQSYSDSIDLWSGSTATIKTGGLNSTGTAVYAFESTLSLKTTGGIWGNSGASGIEASGSIVDVKVTANSDADNSIHGQQSLRSSGSTVTISGALLTASEIGIYTEGDPSDVVVTGNVDAGTGISASPGSEVTVTGDVYGSRIGIEARDGAVVNVAGDVTSDGDEGTGVAAYGANTLVKIDGTITANYYIAQWYWDDDAGEYGEYVAAVKTADDDDATGSPDAQGYRVYTWTDGSVVKVFSGTAPPKLSTDARLLALAGKTINASGAGTFVSPSTASITVPNSKQTISALDFVVAPKAKGTLCNADFRAVSVMPLAVGANHIYIYVRAEDGKSERFYDVTVTREKSASTPLAVVKVAKTKITKLTVGKKLVKLAFKKLAKSEKITKYQIRYHYKIGKKWSKWATKTVTVKSSGASTATTTIKKLKRGKQYQFGVRALKTVASQKHYAPWSTTKTSKKVK